MENSYPKAHVSAVIFDLDGTLLNTELVTKDILTDFLAKYGKVPDNEMEKKRLGATHKESTVAIVKDYQLPLTPEQFSEEIRPMYHGTWLRAKALPGADRLMGHLHKHGVPIALASNSLRNNIDGKISHREGWKERFRVILGSDQVKSGKPSPDLFLEAAKRMCVDPLHCIVIEDSLVGVKAGKAAGMHVVAVPSVPETDSYSIADSILHSLLEFQPELWGLPKFGDWVEKTLPIDPILVVGVFRNGLLHAFADYGLSVLPEQIWGLYVGWAKFEGKKVSKAVVSVGWSDVCNSKRKIQVCIIDGNYGITYDSKMELLIVGYLQRSCNSGNRFNSLEILKDDKLTADAALDLPEFSHKAGKYFLPEDAVEDRSVP